MKSDAIKCGAQNAPHRALYHALGLTEEEADAVRAEPIVLLKKAG